MKTPSQSRSPSLLMLMTRVSKFVAFLKKRWWVLLLTVSLGLCAGAFYVANQPPAYKTSARMMVSGTISLPEGAVYSEELGNFYGTQAELMQSQEIRQRAAARVQALRPELKPSPVELSVAQQRGTSFFILTLVGDEPEYSEAFLNACMEEYIQLKREMRSETSDTALTAISDELVRLDKELRRGEDELLAFQKSNNVVFLEEEGNSAGKYLLQLKQTLAGMKTEYELLKRLSLEQNLERRQQSQTDQPAAVETDGAAAPPSTGVEVEYLKARQDLQLLRAKRESLSRFMRPKHPRIQRVDQEIAQQENLISLYRQQGVAQLKSRQESLELQIANLEKEITEWEQRALELGGRIAEYARIKAKVDRAKALYERLLSSVQSVDVNKNLHQDTLTILDRASTPVTTQPGLVKYLSLGGAAGLILGGGIIAVMILLDDRITSTIDLQENFEEEVLVQIPFEKSKGRICLLDDSDTHEIFAEACRNLRSSLHYMSLDGPKPKTILITSAVPGEGKSTVCTNFAITMASAGSKVLLIDADLRKGTVHNYFGFESKPGFSEVLQGEHSWRDVMRRTSLETLTVISRGQALNKTSEFFVGKAIDTVLRDMYDDFDYIILDSAPVLARDDTTSLAPKIDAVLFVVRAFSTPMRLARTSLSSLYQRQVNVLGLILNAANRNSADYYYYYKYAEYYRTADD